MTTCSEEDPIDTDGARASPTDYNLFIVVDNFMNYKEFHNELKQEIFCNCFFGVFFFFCLKKYKNSVKTWYSNW